MRIGIDIDNIIVNTTETVLKYINERIPVQLELEDIKEYRIENALPDQYKWIVEMAFHDSTMWRQVHLIHGVYDNIKKLYEDGHEIFFVTSTTATNFRKKLNHLNRTFDFFPEDYVRLHSISIYLKQLLKLDILIDDCMTNLIGNNPEYKGICLEYPWNYDNPCIYRTDSWDKIYSIIELYDSLRGYKNG